MHSAVELRSAHDLTDIPSIVRGAVKLGLLESILVLLISLASRLLPNGVLQTVVMGILVVLGLAAVTLLPGLWTRARTIEGIAGAAGIGLGAAVVYLLIDVTLLQNIGTYGHRWYEIGGGSNWWYHPVWWMVGTYLAWMGAFIMANQAARQREPSIGGLVALVLAGVAVFGVLGVVLHVPGAAWSVPTFGIAVLPALALAAIITGLRSRRP